MPRSIRFIGLDIHKHFMVAAGVNAARKEVLPPQRVPWESFKEWMQRSLTDQDRVVIEMTTNTWDIHDALLPHVHSVTVVHPPAVKPVIGHDR